MAVISCLNFEKLRFASLHYRDFGLSLCLPKQKVTLFTDSLINPILINLVVTSFLGRKFDPQKSNLFLKKLLNCMRNLQEQMVFSLIFTLRYFL